MWHSVKYARMRVCFEPYFSLCSSIFYAVSVYTSFYLLFYLKLYTKVDIESSIESDFYCFLPSKHIHQYWLLLLTIILTIFTSIPVVYAPTDTIAKHLLDSGLFLNTYQISTHKWWTAKWPIKYCWISNYEGITKNYIFLKKNRGYSLENGMVYA